MLDLGDEACLPSKAFAKARVRRYGGGDQLQGPIAVEGQMMGAVDDPHPAAADLDLDSVARKDGARGETAALTGTHGNRVGQI